VQVTHRFHPLFGQDFEFVAHRQNWGEDRVHLHDENGELFSLPAGWTDVVPADPFVVIADGRCPFTVDGLLAWMRRYPQDGLSRAISSTNARMACEVRDRPGVRRGYMPSAA
jgi:hypothetical protein